MSSLYTWNNERDFNRANSAIKKIELLNSSGIQSMQNVTQTAIFARITEVIEIATDDPNNNKEAKGVEVFFDVTLFSFVDVSEDPIVYDFDELNSSSATVFTRTNISGKSAMVINQIVKIEPYANLSETSDWLVVETGGGTRAYVVITEVTDAANYIGNVIGGPFDSTVSKTGIAIAVINGVSNPFLVDDSAFADLTKAADGSDVYILDGYLLG